MKDNIFRKKLNELGASAVKAIENFCGGVVKTADELIWKFRDATPDVRRKLISKIGAGFLSFLMLIGFVGCVNENGEIDDTPSAMVTFVDESEIHEVTSYYDPSHVTDPVTKETEEVTKRPEETTRAPETTRPEETTKEPETTREPETTKEPETTTEPEETTKPVEPEKEPEDLPADADGYKYPDYFKTLLHECVVGRGALSSDVNYNKIKNTTPEIIFVERTPNTAVDGSAVIVYAKYDIQNQSSVYTRFAFEINSRDYSSINHASKYSTYAEYVDAIVKALQKKDALVSAEVSEISSSTDNINNKINETFAKFIDEKFVDAQVNCARTVMGETGAYTEISGFGYDKDGKSYSFTAEIDTKAEYNMREFQLIYAMINGEVKKDNLDRFKTTIKAIDSVFTPEVQNEE